MAQRTMTTAQLKGSEAQYEAASRNWAVAADVVQALWGELPESEGVEADEWARQYDIWSAKCNAALDAELAAWNQIEKLASARDRIFDLDSLNDEELQIFESK